MSSLYLAQAELAKLPTGIPWANIAAEMGGAMTPASLQSHYCSVVSSLIDNYVGEAVYAGRRPYILHASVDTEQALTDDAVQTYLDQWGNLIFRPTYRPVINVISGSWVPSLGAGEHGGTPIAFDMNNVEWTGREIIHYGPFLEAGGSPLRVSVTYLDGFANAVLTADAAAGATSLALDDLTGFQPGEEVLLFDVPPEPIVIAQNFVPATGAGALPLAAPIGFAHVRGMRVSALGADAQQMAVYLVQHLVQTRGLVQAQAAWQLLGERTVPTAPTDYLGWAMQLLQNYRLTAY